MNERKNGLNLGHLVIYGRLGLFVYGVIKENVVVFIFHFFWSNHCELLNLIS